MHKSKLLKAIRTLTKKELKSLSLYLQSPYFCKTPQQEELLELFQLIQKYKGKKDQTSLAKVVVYSKLYPGETVVNGKLEKLMSLLLQQVNQFISLHFSEWYGDKELELLTTASFYRERQAFGFYQKNLEKGKSNLEKANDNIAWNLHKKFLLEKECYENQALWNKSTEKYEFYDQLFSLDAYYLLNKLEYTCFFLSANKFRTPLEIEDLVDFLELVKPLYQKKGLLELPIIDIYYRTYELLKEVQTDEVAYWELKEIILTHEATIPFAYLKTLAVYQRNFIIFQYNRGGKHLLDEFFNLYKAHLEKGYLNERTGIIPSTFKNIVTIGLRSKAFDWVYQFLNDYQHKITGTDAPKEVYQFNLAIYHFYKKEFDEALTLLADQYDYLFYKISAKRLELMIYYEMDSELLDSKMDAFKVYIFRLPKKSILPHKRESDNNFINFLRQLRNPRTQHDQQRISRLMANVASCVHLSEKEWLLEKLKTYAVV